MKLLQLLLILLRYSSRVACLLHMCELFKDPWLFDLLLIPVKHVWLAERLFVIQIPLKGVVQDVVLLL